MPRNNLAPAPVNAMVRQSDPLQSLLVESAGYPEYGELTGYLTSRRMLPPIQIRAGHGGEFEHGFFSGLPETGLVRVGSEAGPSTVVHELTHAADRQMSGEYFRLSRKSRSDLSELEKQFMNTYEKLSENPNVRLSDPSRNPRKEMSQRLAPEWTAANSRYRSSSSELPAFGMGGTVAPNVYNPAPLHVDPTMATEFSILLDLASRLQKTRPVTDKR